MGPRLKDVEDWRIRFRVFRGKLASMGPRLKDVEDAAGAGSDRLAAAGFNGATSQGRGRLDPLLQGVAMMAGASMGPRLKDVEDEAIRVDSATLPIRFNGATSQGRGRQLPLSPSTES